MREMSINLENSFASKILILGLPEKVVFFTQHGLEKPNNVLWQTKTAEAAF